MLDNLFPHPVEDDNGDGTITQGEKVLYFLEMIPYTLLSIFLPLLVSNVKKGVADLLPVAVELATHVASSALTGDEKAVNFNQAMKDAAIKEGMTLAMSDINWLRENAVAAIKAAQ